MMIQGFSKGEALRFGWNTTKTNIGFLVSLLTITGLIDFFPNITSFFLELLGKEIPLFSILELIIAGVAWIMSLGWIKIYLNFCDNIKSNISTLFSQYRLFFRLIFASILHILIIALGLLLLIIPGVYLAIQFGFYEQLIVDKKLGPIEALKRSSVITKGVRWNLFVFILISIGINILGALCFIIGLLITVPTTAIAWTFIYRKLLAQVEIIPTSGTSPEGI